jgi:hypothetical protein
LSHEFFLILTYNLNFSHFIMASTSSFGGANGPAANTVSPFPAPPEYAQHYTTENIKHQRILKPPPIPRKFSVFGEEIDMEGVS